MRNNEEWKIKIEGNECPKFRQSSLAFHEATGRTTVLMLLRDNELLYQVCRNIRR